MGKLLQDIIQVIIESKSTYFKGLPAASRIIMGLRQSNGVN